MQIGEENFQFEDDDSGTAVLKIENLLEFDRFQIMGPGNERMHLTFDSKYTKQPGKPTRIVPRPDPDPKTFNGDPTGIFNWAGVIWEATAKGTFSARYDDGSFSVTGTMDSAVASPLLPWQGTAQGHMGHERNGIFLRTKSED